MKNLFKFLSKLTALSLFLMVALNLTNCFCMACVSPIPQAESTQRPNTPLDSSGAFLRRSRIAPTPPPSREDASLDARHSFIPIRAESSESMPTLTEALQKEARLTELLNDLKTKSFADIHHKHLDFLKKHHPVQLRAIEQIAASNKVCLGLIYFIIYNHYDVNLLLEDIKNDAVAIEEILTILKNYTVAVQNIIREAESLLMSFKKGLGDVKLIDFTEDFIKHIIEKDYLNFQETLINE